MKLLPEHRPMRLSTPSHFDGRKLLKAAMMAGVFCLFGGCLFGNSQTRSGHANFSSGSSPLTLAQSPHSDVDTLMQLERDWASKTVEYHHDVSFLERVLAPDFRYTSSDGTVLTRQQLIDDCKVDDAGIATADQMEVFINGNTGIIIGRWRQGKRINRFTDTWVKRDGLWINIAGQATPIRSK
jgi:hypothetical protein